MKSSYYITRRKYDNKFMVCEKGKLFYMSNNVEYHTKALIVGICDSYDDAQKLVAKLPDDIIKNNYGTATSKILKSSQLQDEL